MNRKQNTRRASESDKIPAAFVIPEAEGIRLRKRLALHAFVIRELQSCLRRLRRIQKAGLKMDGGVEKLDLILLQWPRSPHPHHGSAFDSIPTWPEIDALQTNMYKGKRRETQMIHDG